jgi:hypothetical protein
MMWKKIKSFLKEMIKTSVKSEINYYVLYGILDRLRKENEINPNEKTQKEIKELKKVIELGSTDG